jgi:anti-anti-sigma regulatory factor
VLEPHDHVAWYGEGSEDLYALASVALADGARRGEKLMLVAEDPDPQRLAAIGDVERLLASGQLELHTTDTVYGSSCTFSPARQLETFEGVLADALSDGYTGMRVVADNTPLASADEEGFRRWLCWEHVADQFQSTFSVTGVCYFERDALSHERKADLASLHPVRRTNGVETPFCLFADGDAVSATGTLDLFSADRFRRLLEAAPEDRPLVVDLSRAEFVDHRALLLLSAAASRTRPVHVRGTPPLIRELASVLDLAAPYLSFE